MTITKTAQAAVEDLKNQDFFLMIQDASVAGSERDSLRTEKLQQFVTDSLNSVGGQDLSGWGAHIQAELRSGGATLPEILDEIKKLRITEERIDELGIKEVRAANGYTEDGHKIETAAIDIKPDRIMPETQAAYNAAQAAKSSEQSQSVSIDS